MPACTRESGGAESGQGEAALLPHNLRYSVSGDVTRQLDPTCPSPGR